MSIEQTFRSSGTIRSRWNELEPRHRVSTLARRVAVV
jgi:hypothetical protein